MKRHRAFCAAGMLACALVFAAREACAAEAVVDIDTGTVLGPVNKKLFGTNFLGYDPLTYEDWPEPYYGYSDHGAGIWDPQTKQPVREVIELAREAGTSMARFPGGCGTHHYDWKRAVGKGRTHFLFGLDEFLRTCEELGAEPVITVSYFEGDERSAADLVEYLNAPLDAGNPNGGEAWARRRADNGHPAPYGVRYLEIGNEDWHGDHRTVQSVAPEEYAARFLNYYRAIKRVDPGIQLGAILYEPAWDDAVISRVKEKLDFGIIHTYPSPDEPMSRIETMSPAEIFAVSLARPMLKDEPYFRRTLDALRRWSGRDVPLAVTEYNGGFTQDKPVPYRHTLGTALANAELLRVLLHPENRILLANYWQFSNSYWGMIFSQKYFLLRGDPLSRRYVKRPNFYALQLYARHFGDVLVRSRVACGTYDVPWGKGVPLVSAVAAVSSDGRRAYAVIINKDMRARARVRVNNARAADGQAVVRILSGPAVDATNERVYDAVGLRMESPAVRGGVCEFSMPPHSMAALEMAQRE